MNNFQIAFCGRKHYTEYAKKYGWLVGSRSDHVRSNGYSIDDSIDFIDCPFKNWEKHKDHHMEIITRYKPNIAVAPDIYSWNEFDEKMEYADQILSMGIATIVVPKVRGMVKEIPDEFIVGYPVGNKAYSDVVLDEWELFAVRGRPIHLLGSTPNVQIPLILYHNVVSIDMNAFVKAAQKYRRAYSANLGAIDMRGDYHCDEIVIKSIDGIALFWEKFKWNVSSKL